MDAEINGHVNGHTLVVVTGGRLGDVQPKKIPLTDH
jgi:hypothetical protein